jgi:quinoprotein glucose dehydrogenase
MSPTRVALIGLAFVSVSLSAAQNNWVAWGQDAGGTKFSTLAQINTENVRNLKRAWTFHTGDDSGFFESTPIAIDGVLYFSAANGVFAVDGVTGQQLWKYETRNTARRGPAYWPGRPGVGPRLFSSSTNGLVALDPKTGTPIPSFGQDGVVPGLRLSSPPAIYKDVLITQGGSSQVRGYGAVTGELLWILELKAQPGDPAIATWLNDSWKTSGGPGNWGIFTVDADRGLLFVPVEKVGNDYYGGPTPGNNLYSDSVLAVDVTTGKIKWYQQLVHHDIWDYDIAAQPALVEVRRGGQTIPAVAQMTKMGLLFIFHRETGEPIFGWEERPVPQTTARGEWTSPTQPFPVKPPPLARNSIRKTELAKVTPELEAHCAGLWEKYKLEDTVPYNPWREGQDIVVFPGAIGGGNWQGVAFNKPLGFIITNVMNAGQWGHLQEGGGRGRGGRGGRGAAPSPEGEAAASEAAPPPAPAPQSSAPNLNKITPEGGRFWDAAHNYSCAEPPWGELVAVNANTGDVAWRTTIGEFPELEAKGIKTGQPMLGGAMTTAGNLVFIGATIDGIFRAIDARNGKELWREKLDAPAHSIPGTYIGKDGKQYIVVPAGGGGFLRSPTADTMIAFSLN